MGTPQSNDTIEVRKKSEAEKPPQSVVFSFLEYLQQQGYTVNLRPENGVILQVIQAA